MMTHYDDMSCFALLSMTADSSTRSLVPRALGRNDGAFWIGKEGQRSNDIRGLT
ncbi:MAG: hypothetical protein LBK47_05970 [Prevotellaceae bacterium]|nr:hypothetical protein [Prevotellaceae bacterium]